MHLNKTVLIIIFSFLYGCSDHQTGYRDGYGDIDKKKWVVFGRGNYLKGYSSGQADKFQDDWILENPIEPGLLHCPSIIVRADPLMFLPADYKKIAKDIYSSELK